MVDNIDELRYPIGKYVEQPFSETLKKQWLADIKFLPTDIERAIANLDEAQLDTPYRDGGWNLKQVVHHVADSHMNAYCRFKLGFTEDEPSIKPYDENLWATLSDVAEVPINVSITLLHALHTRLHHFLLSINNDDLQHKTVFHPEHKTKMSLWYLLGNYAWHGKHHTAHIISLKQRNNW